MKNLAVFALALVFLVNTSVVSALAKPCMDGMTMAMTQAANQADMANMPCHASQKKQEKKSSEHCAGICLCLHASINQTPIMQDTAAIFTPAVSSSPFRTTEAQMVSALLSPPRRPPKPIS